MAIDTVCQHLDHRAFLRWLELQPPSAPAQAARIIIKMSAEIQPPQLDPPPPSRIMTKHSAKTTVLIRDGDRHFRLAKVFFGSDGSYYSTLPLHRSKKAILMKLTVDYDTGTTVVVGGEDILDTGETFAIHFSELV